MLSWECPVIQNQVIYFTLSLCLNQLGVFHKFKLSINIHKIVLCNGKIQKRKKCSQFPKYLFLCRKNVSLMMKNSRLFKNTKPESSTEESRQRSDKYSCSSLLKFLPWWYSLKDLSIGAVCIPEVFTFCSFGVYLSIQGSCDAEGINFFMYMCLKNGY